MFKNIKNKSVFSVIVVAFFSITSFASENEIYEKKVEAQERLDLVIKIFKENSDLNNDTPIAELDDILKRDLTFIKGQINSEESIEERGTSDVQFIKDEILNIEKWVAENYKSKLTFSVYSTLGLFLCNTLAWGKPTLNEFLNDESNNESLIYNLNYLKNKNTVYDELFTYLQSRAIVIPHISQDGLVPISDMNKAMGFFGKENKTHSAIFLGVGTNDRVPFHGINNHTHAADLFGHDLRHAQLSGAIPLHNVLMDYMSNYACYSSYKKEGHYKEKVNEFALFLKRFNEKNIKHRDVLEMYLFEEFHEIGEWRKPSDLIQRLKQRKEGSVHKFSFGDNKDMVEFPYQASKELLDVLTEALGE